MRKTLAVMAAPLAAAACASTNPAPIVYAGRIPSASPPPAPAPPPRLSPYAAAAPAPVRAELYVCSWTGQNLGPVSVSGASLLFTPYIEEQGITLLRNPTEAACLSSGFGDRVLASGGSSGRNHTGIDLANPQGGYIYAAAAGRIVSAGWKGDYGNAVEIDHGSGVRTLYGHMSEVDPSLVPGGWVEAAAPIGRMGRTGNATGVHLHYEVWVNGAKVDPLKHGLPPAAPEAPGPIS